MTAAVADPGLGNRYGFLYGSQWAQLTWATPVVAAPPKPAHGRRAIVLDLDETLVKTWAEHPVAISEIPANMMPRTYYSAAGRGVKRQYLTEFLNYVRQRFDYVIVWTAGNKVYADQIVRFIFTEYQPDRVYTYDDCEFHGQDFFKPLKRVYDDFELEPSDVVAVDNRNLVFQLGDQHNLVHIPDYIPDLKTQHDIDWALFELTNRIHTWDLRQDCRTLNKSGIFTLDTIYH